MRQQLQDFHAYTSQIILTNFFSVMLFVSISSLLPSITSNLMPGLQGWHLASAQVAIASAGLWLVNRNGKKPKVKARQATAPQG